MYRCCCTGDVAIACVTDEKTYPREKEESIWGHVFGGGAVGGSDLAIPGESAAAPVPRPSGGGRLSPKARPGTFEPAGGDSGLNEFIPWEYLLTCTTSACLSHSAVSPVRKDYRVLAPATLVSPCLVYSCRYSTSTGCRYNEMVIQEATSLSLSRANSSRGARRIYSSTLKGQTRDR